MLAEIKSQTRYLIFEAAKAKATADDLDLRDEPRDELIITSSSQPLGNSVMESTAVKLFNPPLPRDPLFADAAITVK